MRHLARAAAGGLPCLLVCSLVGCAAAGTRADGSAEAKRADAADAWAALAPVLGKWEGKSDGSPGAGTVRREYRLVLGGRFIEVRNQSTYPPQPKNPKGEVHEDVGYISRDRARRAFVLRQFHVEGFVNTYVAPAAAAANAQSIVFTSEAIENIPPGWRARETYRFPSPDAMVEVFELAEPGKDFTVYTETRLERVKRP